MFLATRSVRWSLVISLISFAATAVAQTPPDPPILTIQLFNGKNLDGLHAYVDDRSVDVAEVWKVEEGVLRTDGQHKGYIRTEMPYADYKLQLDWRWPAQPGNSGVLIHLVNGDVLWPKGFEVQLASGRAGDLSSYVDARSKEEIVSRNPTGFSTGRLSHQGESTEKPVGEWNTLQVVAAGNTLTIWVNDIKTNQMTDVVPGAGMIGLQSEGTPIDFRKITLTPLTRAKNLHAPMPVEPIKPAEPAKPAVPTKPAEPVKKP